MNARRTRRLLAIAFAISLLVHVLIALRVVSPFAVPKEDVQIVRIERARTLHVSRIPTPPPATPPPVTPSPRPSAVATAPGKPKTKAVAKSGSGSAGAGGVPRATLAPATPAPSPTANCATSDTPVTLASKPEQPDIPPLARGDGTNGTAKVQVSVDATGAVREAAVVTSSGNPALDVIAVSMARGAHYAPAQHACKAIAGTYTFGAKFVSW